MHQPQAAAQFLQREAKMAEAAKEAASSSSSKFSTEKQVDYLLIINFIQSVFSRIFKACSTEFS